MASSGATRRPRIAVYCGSHLGHDPEFAATSAAVGRAIAGAGADLIFGGGRIGLMGVVADAALEGGSNVVGVITEALSDKEIAHEGVTELRVVTDMPARKQQMYSEADAFLTLPGGVGTMEEFFEVLTWAYLGLHPKPIGLVNISNYYEPLLALLDHAVKQGLGRPAVREHLVIAKDATIVHELLERIGAS